MSLSIEKFQDNKTQIGVKNAVNKDNSKLKPSMPKEKLKCEAEIQLRL